MDKVGVINYGLGNLGSIVNMYRYLGVEVELINSADEIMYYRKVILPGVGHFAAGMQQIKSRGVDGVLKEFVKESSNKLLGICLGMQLLFDSSEEGQVDGLGLLRGHCLKFTPCNKLPVPHMGWNCVYPNTSDQLFKMPFKQPRFYFAHSYYVSNVAKDATCVRANYGLDFPASVIRENIMGVQFHPEKSHKFGLALLKNFVSF